MSQGQLPTAVAKHHHAAPWLHFVTDNVSKVDVTSRTFAVFDEESPARNTRQLILQPHLASLSADQFVLFFLNFPESKPGLLYGFGGLIASVMGRDLHEATEATPKPSPSHHHFHGVNHPQVMVGSVAGKSRVSLV
jgi:hypothetical protein